MIRINIVKLNKYLCLKKEYGLEDKTMVWFRCDTSCVKINATIKKKKKNLYLNEDNMRTGMQFISLDNA